MKEETQLKNEWIKRYGLTAISTTKFYKIAGCFIIGFELIKTQGEIQPHFVVYPLWKDNVKECFSYPYILHCIEDSKGFNYQLPVSRILEDINTIFQNIDNYLGCDLRNHIHKDEILKIVDSYTSIARYIPHVQICMIELKVFLAIYFDDNLLFEYAKSQMDEIYAIVGQDSFEFCADCKYEEWKSSLISVFSDRQNFLKKINENRIACKIKEEIDLLP